MVTKIKMIATSGDLAKNGMSSEATIINVTKEQWLTIEKYQHLTMLLHYSSKMFTEDKRIQSLITIQNEYIQKLKSVFKNKYYYRTSWSIVE